MDVIEGDSGIRHIGFLCATLPLEQMLAVCCRIEDMPNDHSGYTRHGLSAAELHVQWRARSCALCAALGRATYPTRALRIVVPFAPAGSTDVLARIVGQRSPSAGPTRDRRQSPRQGHHRTDLVARPADGTHWSSVDATMAIAKACSHCPMTRCGTRAHRLVGHVSAGVSGARLIPMGG